MYPDLSGSTASDTFNYQPQTPQRPPPPPQSSQYVPEDVSVLLQIPQQNISCTLVECEDIAAHSRVNNGALSIYAPVREDFGPTIEIGSEVVELNESLYVLHSDLETFVLGGVVRDQNGEPVRGGPIPGKTYQMVIKLNNVPDDYLINLTCIFMNNSNYKSLFAQQGVDWSEMDTGDKIGHVIGVSAHGLSTGLAWTGEKTKDLIKYGSERYVAETTPKQTPTQVSGTTKKAVEYASIGTKYLAKGTGVVAKAIGQAASYVGQEIAAEVQRNSSKNPKESKHKETWIQVGKVIKSAVAAYGEIWNALETTGKSVAVSMRDNTATAVSHKHGTEAGGVAYQGMDIGVNCTKTVFHVQDMGVKRICKNVAKSAGKSYLHIELEKRRKDKPVQPTAPPQQMITSDNFQ